MNIINVEFLYVIILFSGIICGYMISDFPKQILNIFTTPMGQFFTILIILTTIRKDIMENFNYTTLIKIIFETSIMVIILQSLKRILRYIYEK